MATLRPLTSRICECAAIVVVVGTTRRASETAGAHVAVAGAMQQTAAALGQFGPGETTGYLDTVLLLAVLALLAILLVGFARVMLAFKIEQRRKRMLADTRDIHELAPCDFEAYVGVLFEKAGYRVKRTGGRGDHGVDLLVVREGTRYVVQCKRYEETIRPSTVREMIGAMTNAGVKQGFLVTTSRFSAGAEFEAQESPYDIDLIDGPKLVRWARAYGLPAELMELEPSRGRSV